MIPDLQARPWTYAIAREHGRVWLQSSERFASTDEAAIALGLYLALTPESSGFFIGKVILARDSSPSFEPPPDYLNQIG